MLINPVLTVLYPLVIFESDASVHCHISLPAFFKYKVHNTGSVHSRLTSLKIKNKKFKMRLKRKQSTTVKTFFIIISSC